MITKSEKVTTVTELIDMFSKNKAVFMVDGCGLVAYETQMLRKKLYEIGGKMVVAKNTLLRISANSMQSNKMNEIMNKFTGQIALIFAQDDVVGTTTLMKEYGFGATRAVYGGFFEDVAFEKERFNFFASIPAKNILHARLCGILKFGTIGKLVNVLHQVSIAKSGEKN